MRAARRVQPLPNGRCCFGGEPAALASALDPEVVVDRSRDRRPVMPQSGPLPRLCPNALPLQATTLGDRVGEIFLMPIVGPSYCPARRPLSACGTRRRERVMLIYGGENEMFSHIMIGSNDIARSKKFYDALFAAMGAPPGVEDARGRLAYSHRPVTGPRSRPVPAIWRLVRMNEEYPPGRS